jgi:hypothetical protein
MKSLTQEGFFKIPNKRTKDDVARALEAKGMSTKGKQDNISRILALRVKRGILKMAKTQGGSVYWAE